MSSEAKAWVCIIGIVVFGLVFYGTMKAAAEVGVARATACMDAKP